MVFLKVCRRVLEGAHAEKVFVRIKAVTKNLFWIICHRYSRFWSFTFLAESLCVLVTTSREEVTPCSVCG